MEKKKMFQTLQNHKQLITTNCDFCGCGAKCAKIVKDYDSFSKTKQYQFIFICENCFHEDVLDFEPGITDEEIEQWINDIVPIEATDIKFDDCPVCHSKNGVATYSLNNGISITTRECCNGKLDLDGILNLLNKKSKIVQQITQIDECPECGESECAELFKFTDGTSHITMGCIPETIEELNNLIDIYPKEYVIKNKNIK